MELQNKTDSKRKQKTQKIYLKGINKSIFLSDVLSLWNNQCFLGSVKLLSIAPPRRIV